MTGLARRMMRQAGLWGDEVPAKQLGAFDDLLVPLDVQALHSRIGKPAGGKRKA